MTDKEFKQLLESAKELKSDQKLLLARQMDFDEQQDNGGQILFYTGLMYKPNPANPQCDRVVDFVENDNDEEEDRLGPDPYMG